MKETFLDGRVMWDLRFDEMTSDRDGLYQAAGNG